MMYAEEVNYWQTSRSSPHKWIDRAKKEIASIGGVVHRNGYAAEIGRAAYMMEFALDGNSYRMLWPVLESKSKNATAAHVQAATAMFHAVKGAVVNAKFLGGKVAFFPYLQVGDGLVASDLAGPELRERVPIMLAGPRALEIVGDSSAVRDKEAIHGNPN